MIKSHKILSIITIPVILGLYSWLDNHPTRVKSDHIEIRESTLNGPDHIHSVEYRMILEKTYLDLYGTINEEMYDQDFKWLGFCTDCEGEIDIDDRTLKRCGDKVEWGGNIFCLMW